MMGEDLSGWVVLVVENDPDNLSLALQLLSHYGAEVHTAGDGVEGLEILSTVQPTVILLDLAMPEMSGWEMIGQVRARPKLAATPVIAVTAHAMEADRKRSLEAGFDGHISKPFDVLTFVEQVRQIVAAKGSSR